MKDFKKAEKVTIPDEKVDRIIAKIVLNNLPNLIRDQIFDFLQENRTFEEIGEIFGVNRSIIWKIYNDNYFPKKAKLKNQFLEKYLELI